MTKTCLKCTDSSTFDTAGATWMPVIGHRFQHGVTDINL